MRLQHLLLPVFLASSVLSQDNTDTASGSVVPEIPTGTRGSLNSQSTTSSATSTPSVILVTVSSAGTSFVSTITPTGTSSDAGASSTSGAASAAGSSDNNAHRNRILAIVLGTVLGALALGLLILVCILCLARRRKRRDRLSRDGSITSASDEYLNHRGKTANHHVSQVNPGGHRGLDHGTTTAAPLMSETRSSNHALGPHPYDNQNGSLGTAPATTREGRVPNSALGAVGRYDPTSDPSHNHHNNGSLLAAGAGGAALGAAAAGHNRHDTRDFSRHPIEAGSKGHYGPNGEYIPRSRSISRDSSAPRHSRSVSRDGVSVGSHHNHPLSSGAAALGAGGLAGAAAGDPNHRASRHSRDFSRGGQYGNTLTTPQTKDLRNSDGSSISRERVAEAMTSLGYGGLDDDHDHGPLRPGGHFPEIYASSTNPRTAPSPITASTYKSSNPYITQTEQIPHRPGSSGRRTLTPPTPSRLFIPNSSRERLPTDPPIHQIKPEYDHPTRTGPGSGSVAAPLAGAAVANTGVKRSTHGPGGVDVSPQTNSWISPHQDSRNHPYGDRGDSVISPISPAVDPHDHGLSSNRGSGYGPISVVTRTPYTTTTTTTTSNTTSNRANRNIVPPSSNPATTNLTNQSKYRMSTPTTLLSPAKAADSHTQPMPTSNPNIQSSQPTTDLSRSDSGLVSAVRNIIGPSSTLRKKLSNASSNYSSLASPRSASANADTVAAVGSNRASLVRRKPVPSSAYAGRTASGNSIPTTSFSNTSSGRSQAPLLGGVGPAGDPDSDMRATTMDEKDIMPGNTRDLDAVEKGQGTMGIRRKSVGSGTGVGRMQSVGKAY